VGCGLHARVPQLKPLLDAVHRTTNGAAMEGAVAMELGALYFACEEKEDGKKKSPPKHITCLNRQSRNPQPRQDAVHCAANDALIERAGKR